MDVYPVKDSDQNLLQSLTYWAYGLGAIAVGVKNHAFSYLLLFYSIHVLNISGFMASLALAIAMVWDAITDPILGQVTDKTRTRIGRRHPYMYLSLLVLPAAFWMLFNPPWDLNETGRFVYLLICCLLVRTGTTVFEVPSVAQIPELELDYERRNRWLSLRVALGWLGGNCIHTVNLFYWVGAYGASNPTGYTIYATWGAAIIFMMILLSSLGTQRHGATRPQPKERFRFSEIIDEFRQMGQSLGNRNFASLFVYAVLTGVTGGLGAALYMVNVQYYFGFTLRQVTVTGIAVFLSPVIAYGLAPIMGQWFGKRRGAMIAISSVAIMYPVPFLLVLAGWWPELGSTSSLIFFSGIVVFEVVCLVISGVFVDSMMADVVEHSELRTERRSEGLFYAARTFGNKAISALGIIFAGAIVSLVGFDGITDIAQVTRADRVNMSSLFLPAYCGITLVSIGVLTFYRITKQEHESHLEILASRREQLLD